MSALAEDAPRVARWRRYPLSFIEDNWPRRRRELDGWQEEAFEYCGSPGRKRLGLQAAAGVGKTFVLAAEGWRRLACYARGPHHPKGAAVSMDGRNLAANLVPEMAMLREESPFLREYFDLNGKRAFCKAHKDTWFLDFRAWPRRANAEEMGRTLSGIHSLFPFVLLDESASIPWPVFRTAQQIETYCEDSLIGQAGNPSSREGCLYVACVKQSHLGKVIKITAHPEDPKRCQRIPVEYVLQQITESELGWDDPWVQCFLLGEFPAGALNQLLTIEDIEEAMERAPKPEEWNWAAKIIAGDVAREGLNFSVFYKRQHTMVWGPIIRRRGITSGITGAALVAREVEGWGGADAIFLDNTGGFGGSWLDQLRVLKYSPVGVQYSSKPLDMRFYNKRTEMYFTAAEAIHAGCAIPKGAQQLLGDLTTPTYTFVKDRLLLEDKKSVSARLCRSPDDGDAFVNLWAYPVAGSAHKTLAYLQNRRAGTTVFDDHGWS